MRANASGSRQTDGTPLKLRLGGPVSSDRISAISLAAMSHGDDFDGVAKVMEADAIVADTETELWRFDVMEPLNVAFAAREDAGQSVKNAESRSLINRAQVRLGPLAPNDFLRHLLLVWAVRLKWRAAHLFEVLGAKAELGENLFVGNSFATCKGSLGFLKLASLFRSYRFVVIRSAGQGASERVEDDLQETNHG
jgi:hypothetical protein